MARGCIATQEATQLRKYATSSDSALSESANLGNRELQGVLERAGGDPAKLDEQALARVSDRSDELYRDALHNESIPPEFENADHYLVSALGVRVRSVERLEDAANGRAGNFEQMLSSSAADWRLSDALVSEHFLPAASGALGEAGQSRDRTYLHDPRPFMDYEAAGVEEASGNAPAFSGGSSPNALHGVEIKGVRVAGKPLYPGGNVTLTGSDELNFSVAVTNGGEVAENGIPIEVVVNTRAERQSQGATIRKIEPQSSATVEVRGFRPGELNEAAEVSVEAGPVEYEKYLKNNALDGTVTFGL